jgi:hypothetical protein
LVDQGLFKASSCVGTGVLDGAREQSNGLVVIVDLSLGNAGGKNGLLLIVEPALGDARGNRNNGFLVGFALGKASGGDGVFLAVFCNASGGRLLGCLKATLVSGYRLEYRSNSSISDRPCQKE